MVHMKYVMLRMFVSLLRWWHGMSVVIGCAVSPGYVLFHRFSSLWLLISTRATPYCEKKIVRRFSGGGCGKSV